MIIFNEFVEDTANEFEREEQLCATGSEKVHKCCPFYSILFLPDIIYVLYKI